MRGKNIRVGEALDKMIDRRSKKSPGRLQARVDEVWNEVAGDEIAKHTIGFGVRDGALLVHVDTHAWAAQLTFISEELRRSLNEVLGGDQVRAIRFTVTRTVGDERKRKAKEQEARRRYGGEVVTPVALEPRERERIEQEAAEIESDRLREAATRARVRALEWEKGQKAASAREKRTGGS